MASTTRPMRSRVRWLGVTPSGKRSIRAPKARSRKACSRRVRSPGLSWVGLWVLMGVPPLSRKRTFHTTRRCGGPGTARSMRTAGPLTPIVLGSDPKSKNRLPTRRRSRHRTEEVKGMQAAARWLRTIFLAGLAVVVAVVLTAYLVWFVFSRLVALMAGVVAAVVGRPVPGGGVVASLALVLAVGVVATNFLGRRVIRAAEQFVERIPGIRTVYGAIKEIMHSVVRPQRGQFRRAVLVEFPPGLYMLGFVTQEAIPSRYRGA